MKKFFIFASLVIMFNSTSHTLNASQSGVSFSSEHGNKPSDCRGSFNVMETKKCYRCEKYLPLNLFYKDNSKDDKLNIYCKNCLFDLRCKKVISNEIYIDKQNEEWKDIIGYEGLYKISNYGTVKSLERINANKNNNQTLKQEHNTTGTINKYGYLEVNIRRGIFKKKFRIHRLIAIHFIDNPLNKPFINHINGVKTDNRIENLEWCTHQENTTHAILTGLTKKTTCSDYVKKAVIDTYSGIKYESVSDAAKSIKTTECTLINYLKGRWNKNKRLKFFMYETR